MAFDNNVVDSETYDNTRIVTRNDGTPEEIEKMIQESKEYRTQYWEQLGKDAMYDMIDFCPSMPEYWRKKFFELTWQKRQVFGQDMKAISGGIRNYAVHIGRTSAPLKAAKARVGSRYSKKLCSLVLRSFINSNIIKITNHSALSCGFVVPKPKPPPNTPSTKTLADLENPELTVAHLTSAYRFVIDLAGVSRSSQEFSSPNITPREILSTFTKGKIFLTLDCLSFFYQCLLSKESRYLTAFTTVMSALQYCLTRTPQGHAASSAAASLILKLVLIGLLVPELSFLYVDNVGIADYTYVALFETYKKILERADEYNLVFK